MSAISVPVGPDRWPCGCVVTDQDRKRWRALQALRVSKLVLATSVRCVAILAEGSPQALLEMRAVASSAYLQTKHIEAEPPPWVLVVRHLQLPFGSDGGLACGQPAVSGMTIVTQAHSIREPVTCLGCLRFIAKELADGWAVVEPREADDAG